MSNRVNCNASIYLLEVTQVHAFWRSCYLPYTSANSFQGLGGVWDMGCMLYIILVNHNACGKELESMYLNPIFFFKL